MKIRAHKYLLMQPQQDVVVVEVLDAKDESCELSEEKCEEWHASTPHSTTMSLLNYIFAGATNDNCKLRKTIHNLQLNTTSQTRSIESRRRLKRKFICGGIRQVQINNFTCGYTYAKKKWINAAHMNRIVQHLLIYLFKSHKILAEMMSTKTQYSSGKVNSEDEKKRFKKRIKRWEEKTR